jgi:hypothetical protein
MILSSRVARTAGVIYFSVLHLLVFLVLYRLAYTETCHRDMAAECAQKYPQSMIYQCQLSSANAFHLLRVSLFSLLSFVGMTITCWKRMDCTTEKLRMISHVSRGRATVITRHYYYIYFICILLALYSQLFKGGGNTLNHSGNFFFFFETKSDSIFTVSSSMDFHFTGGQLDILLV